DNYGTLGATNVTFSGNIGLCDGGGAIHNEAGAILTITNSIFSGNSGNGGGAIYNEPGAGLTATNSTFAGNSSIAGAGGGAIYSEGSVTLIGSTFSSNS